MKRKFGTRFFFDMRGFWADEKKDGGAWSDTHPVFKRVYRYYKKREADYLQHADHVISLTEAGRKEMETWSSFKPGTPLTVIPCCADMAHFTITDSDQKREARQRLSISREALVFSYLGSVGAWYMLDKMLELFTVVKKSYPGAVFLFITHSDKAYIRKKATGYSLDPADFIIIEAKRDEVPILVKASDINISFIKPVYSKLSSSPTKLGEVLSMGIPVIVNAGVGDVEMIVNATGGGLVLKDLSPESMEMAVSQVPRLLTLDPSVIREKAKSFFDLDRGISLYERAYTSLFAN
jgi:glycosyltransferase involved in cell wall biosynthesis